MSAPDPAVHDGSLATLLTFEALPFCIGAQPEPHNPVGLPDAYPFELCLDERTGVLRQRNTLALQKILGRVYALGVELGTPTADTEQARPYVADFFAFLTAHVRPSGRALEIGAGVGYLSARLAKAGWTVDSLEPGKGYSANWQHYGVEMINDFFPSPRASGPYHLIVFYTVLEHLPDAAAFLRTVVEHLAVDGIVALGVPDCREEIAAGDPSMLLHEHYHYFTAAGLRRCLENAGLQATVVPSRYGRSLFAVARRGEGDVDRPGEKELTVLRRYPERARALSLAMATRLDEAASKSSVGIYCPARALAVLPHEARVRFFDDAPDLRGKYYPPFTSQIEDREGLLANPPDALWIMSRTFGATLKAQLAPALPRTPMMLLSGLAQ